MSNKTNIINLSHIGWLVVELTGSMSGTLLSLVLNFYFWFNTGDLELLLKYNFWLIATKILSTIPSVILNQLLPTRFMGVFATILRAGFLIFLATHQDQVITEYISVSIALGVISTIRGDAFTNIFFQFDDSELGLRFGN